MENRLTKLCDKLIEYFQWDEQSRTKTRGDSLRDKVYSVRENAKNYAAGITILYNAIHNKETPYCNCFCDYVFANRPSDFSEKRIYHLTTYLHLIGEIVELYENWTQDSLSMLTSNLIDHSILKRDKFTISPSTIDKIDHLISSKRFSLHRYKGDVNFDPWESYSINPHILFHSRIDKLIESIHPSSHTLITCCVLVNREVIRDSRWVFIITKEDSVYLLIENISEVASIRSIWENEGDGVRGDLPYNIFQNSEHFIKSTFSLGDRKGFIKVVVKDYSSIHNNNVTEIERDFTNDISKLLEKEQLGECGMICKSSMRRDGNRVSLIVAVYHKGEMIGVYNNSLQQALVYVREEVSGIEVGNCFPEQRFLLIAFSHKILQNLSQQNLSHNIITGFDLMNNLLLSGRDLSYFDHIKDNTSRHSYEIIKKACYTEDTNTPLEMLHIPYSLSSIDSQENHMDNIYHHLTIRDKRQIQKYYSLQKDPTTHNLVQALNSNIDKIHRIAYKASDVEIISSMYSTGNTPQDVLVARIRDVVDDESLKMRKGVGIGKPLSKDETCLCSCCESFTGKIVKEIEIYHHRGFYAFIDDISKIPSEYKSYRSNKFFLNDSVSRSQPLERVVDKASRNFPEMIVVNIYLCGRCHSKKSKDSVEYIKVCV